jgi:hypothetical protein
VLTLFTAPKSFVGHFALIQANAVRSWLALRPRPEVVLLGDDDGVAEAAKHLGVRHVPTLARNQFGTPLFSDILSKGQQEASSGLVCFLNADIILLPEWLQALGHVREWRREFMMVGRRWDLDITEPLDFLDVEAGANLGRRAREHGRVRSNMTIDYFAFPRGLLVDIPPFAVGRPGYDNWLLWHVRDRGIPLVDATHDATVIHQNHDYSHIKAQGRSEGGESWFWKGLETEHNTEWVGGWPRYYTINHATHVVRGGRVRRARGRDYLGARWETLKRHVIVRTARVRHALGLRKRTPQTTTCPPVP